MALPNDDVSLTMSRHGNMADRDDLRPAEASETATFATRHRSGLRERAGKDPGEPRRSRKTQKLEAMAAEMLHKDEGIEAQHASTRAEPSPVQHLKLPPYGTFSACQTRPLSCMWVSVASRM
jgi:hypothetical protein